MKGRRFVLAETFCTEFESLVINRFYKALVCQDTATLKDCLFYSLRITALRTRPPGENEQLI